MSETIISLSDFKAEASRILNDLQGGTPPVVLTQNGRASAVVQSYEEYQRMQRAMLLLKLVAQGEADSRAGHVTPQKDVFVKARARLAGRLKSHG